MRSLNLPGLSSCDRALRIAVASILLILVNSCTTGKSLEDKAREKMARLEDLISEADEAGIQTEKERMTLRTAEIFLTYADWDEANIDKNHEYFKHVPVFEAEAEKLAQELADFERTEVIKILDEANTRLKLILKGEYKRKAYPPIDWSRVELSGNQLVQDGRPVFLVDHVWKPGVPELEEYYGAMDGSGMSPRMVLNEKGEIHPETINRLKEKKETNTGSVWIGNNGMPEWALEKYGNFNAGGGIFGDYDIDNPGARELYGFMYDGMVPHMAGKKYTKLGYMLFNEPSFFTQTGVWNTRAVSEYTKKKFRDWLKKRHASITDLNELWGSDFESFNEVKITIPIESSLQGTPMWYDWMVFNNHRVTEWFKFVKRKIREHDPEAKVHIKLMPWLWTGDKKDHGIDFETLTRLCDICGCDAATKSSDLHGRIEEWMERYSFEWVEVSMMFDFFRSVQPDQIIFDTETHILSSVHFRDLYLKPDYVRATYWLAHMHGLNVSRNWYWPRSPSGEVNVREPQHYPGTNNQQPAVTNELHATLIDLNSYSEEITAIQQQRKPLRIWYSLTNAISRKDYMHDVFRTYEALYFEGVPLGFATEGIIRNEDTGEWDAIIVRENETLTQGEFDALQDYLNAGGTLIVDQASLKKDEYGSPLGSLNAGTGKIIPAWTLDETVVKALNLIETGGLHREVLVKETNPSGHKSCVWRCVKNSAGNYVVSIVNIGKTEAPVNISIRGTEENAECTDLINGIPVPSGPVLKPDQVYFVEVRKSP